MNGELSTTFLQFDCRVALQKRRSCDFLILCPILFKFHSSLKSLRLCLSSFPSWKHVSIPTIKTCKNKRKGVSNPLIKTALRLSSAKNHPESRLVNP